LKIPDWKKIFCFSFRESEMITIRLVRFHPRVRDCRAVRADLFKKRQAIVVAGQ
jgi:hypothetical protein